MRCAQVPPHLHGLEHCHKVTGIDRIPHLHLKGKDKACHTRKDCTCRGLLLRFPGRLLCLDGGFRFSGPIRDRGDLDVEDLPVHLNAPFRGELSEGRSWG